MQRFLLTLLLVVASILGVEAAKIDSLKIPSAKMGREIKTLVIVPEAAATTSMPVLYLLHGYSGNEVAWMRLRDLRLEAERYGMIIVCPNGNNSWWWDSPRNKDSQFETFLSKELPEYVDSNYNTVPCRTARAISGLSMGGHGAMWNALRHRDVFGAVASMSGGLDIRPFPNNWLMKVQLGEKSDNEELWEQHTCANAIKGLKNGELAMLIDCGVDDFFIGVNRAFHEALVEQKVSHDYIERAGAHTSQYWSNSIKYHLHYFNEYFTAKAEERRLRKEAQEGTVATIDNGQIRVQISKKGAEMFSLKDVIMGEEHLWQGDPTYWKFRSPVLFPIVGAVYDNKYRIDDKEYAMTIHGIARDYDYEIIKHNQTEIVYRLTSTPEMKANYPYDFVLEIGYRLVGTGVKVSYKVTNPSDETIHFQLGAHPGFNFKNFDSEAPVQGYYSFDDVEKNSKLTLSLCNKAGFTTGKKRTITLDGKRLAITKDTFNNGAMIIEGEQTKSVSLLDAAGKPYIKVTFPSPVVGLWSNAVKGYAPFTCIEPWYGRCDSDKYKGDFKTKEWVQALPAKETFKTDMSISVLR